MIKIYFFLFSLFFLGCANKDIIDYGVKDIEILSDEEGEGEEVRNHYKVLAHYIGTLENGIEFDNSYKNNKPIQFQMGLRQVIPGLELGIIGIKKNGKRKFKIPPSLAYGQKGIKNKIPPNSTLIFEIEILNIERFKYIEINPDNLINLLSNKLLKINNVEIVLIDIRSKNDIFSDGYIEGSYLIEAFDKKGNFKKNFLKQIKLIKKDKSHLVLISNNGDISSILANGFVENLGYKNIYSLQGGIKNWIKNYNVVFEN